MMEIGVDGYSRLNPEVRHDFDLWLKEERLCGEEIVWLRLGEGEVLAECYLSNADGSLRLDDSGFEFETALRSFPIKTLPPKATFA